MINLDDNFFVGRSAKWCFGEYGGEPPLVQTSCIRKFFLHKEPTGHWFKSIVLKPYGEGLEPRLYCKSKIKLTPIFTFCASDYTTRTLTDYFNLRKLR